MAGPLLGPSARTLHDLGPDFEDIGLESREAPKSGSPNDASPL